MEDAHGKAAQGVTRARLFQHKMFHHFDEVLLHSRKLDSHVVKMLTRYALKEAWYINKIHNQG